MTPNERFRAAGGDGGVSTYRLAYRLKSVSEIVFTRDLVTSLRFPRAAKHARNCFRGASRASLIGFLQRCFALAHGAIINLYSHNSHDAFEWIEFNLRGAQLSATLPDENGMPLCAARGMKRVTA